MNKSYPAAISLLALMTLGGCASINDCCYEKTQTVRAFKEYIKCGNPECSSYPHDYKCGWLDGFYEVATGGESCPPAVAPARYYKPDQILKHCDKKRHAYYSGWQDGASRASQFPDTHYLRIYETCECPFPRCDKPCGDGACAPCGVAFVGLSASAELIEAVPVVDTYPAAMMQSEIVIPAEEHNIQSSSNREKGPEREEPFEEKDGVEVDGDTESFEIPVPEPDASVRSTVPVETTNVASWLNQTSSDSLPLPPSNNVKSSIDAQSVGFVRLVAPLDQATVGSDVSSEAKVTPVAPVAIVEATKTTFELLETPTSVQLAR